jgi:hypothetical protein
MPRDQASTGRGKAPVAEHHFRGPEAQRLQLKAPVEKHLIVQGPLARICRQHASQIAYFNIEALVIHVHQAGCEPIGEERNEAITGLEIHVHQAG